MADGDPKVLVVALGGNDGLRGLPPEQLERNLATIIEQRAEPRSCASFSPAWKRRRTSAPTTRRGSAQVYPALAERYKVPLIPFLLDGVAGNPSLNQADGIHPNPRGAQVVADLVWRALEPELTASDTSDPMIELRGVSKTVQSGGQPLTILHPLDVDGAGGAVPGDHRSVRAAASPRCSA